MCRAAAWAEAGPSLGTHIWKASSLSHTIPGLLLLVAAPVEPVIVPPEPANLALVASGEETTASSLATPAGDELTEAAVEGGALDAAEAPLPTEDFSEDPANSNDIVVAGSREAPKEDPLEQANVQSYEAVQAIDKAIVAPVAMGYKSVVPKPVRSGVRNFINNLDEPVVALNFLLQLKPGKAAETLGRFAINSTIGIGGLIDVAKDKPFNLPRRYNGLANTLGYYGVGPGPYLFLPVVGPTTARDFVGRIVDFSIVPRVVGPPLSNTEVSISKGVLGALSDRIADDARIRRLRDQSDDGYGEIRKNYLERRQAEIDQLKGRSAAVPPVTEPSPEPARP